MATDRGDVRELLDANGDAFAFYSYDAYGTPDETLSRGTATVPAGLAADIASRNVLRYAGYCYDEVSGLYYLSQRYYDPASACFVSKDPARADGEESAYQYCAGDPVGKSDPSGLEPRGARYDDGYGCYTRGRAYWSTKQWKHKDRIVIGKKWTLLDQRNVIDKRFSVSLFGPSVSVGPGSSVSLGGGSYDPNASSWKLTFYTTRVWREQKWSSRNLYYRDATRLSKSRWQPGAWKQKGRSLHALKVTIKSPDGKQTYTRYSNGLDGSPEETMNNTAAMDVKYLRQGWPGGRAWRTSEPSSKTLKGWM